jgi:hypothetical protein
MDFARYDRFDEFIVAHMASAPIELCACTLPYDQECDAQRCRACRATVLNIVNWCSRNLRDRHGHFLGRLYVRRALLNDAAIWNAVRRGQLDRRRAELPPRVVVVVAPVLTEDCAICLEEVIRGQAVYLPCTHQFHNDCINRWLRRQRTCPVCRGPF